MVRCLYCKKIIWWWQPYKTDMRLLDAIDRHFFHKECFVKFCKKMVSGKNSVDDLAMNIKLFLEVYNLGCEGGKLKKLK